MTALILFTLPAAEEARRKPLGVPAGSASRQRLFRALIARSRGVLEKAHAGDVWISTSTGYSNTSRHARYLLQRGSTFGERFAGVLQDAFDLGYEQVLIVGNDSPELTSGRVQGALGLLANHPGRAVVGPAPDGGFYLLAMDRASWQAVGARDLEQLPWCSHETFRSLEALFQRRGVRVFRQLAVRDLDTVMDLRAFAASASGHRSFQLRQLTLALCSASAERGFTRGTPRVPNLSAATPRSPRPPPSANSLPLRSA